LLPHHVPLLSQVIIGLLRAAMVRSGASDFLIDGFPRALDQAEMFERTVKPAELVLAFDCPEEVMEARLLKRGETSGRSDDNAATIRKRFETFVSQSMPVISHYEQLGKCHRISAIPTPEEVFEAVQAVVEGKVCDVALVVRSVLGHVLCWQLAG
jgi:adenylate kinase